MKIFTPPGRESEQPEILIFIDVFRASSTLTSLLHGGIEEVAILRTPEEAEALPGTTTLFSELVAKNYDNSPTRALTYSREWAAGIRHGADRVAFISGNLTPAIHQVAAEYASAEPEIILCCFLNLSAVVTYVRKAGYKKYRIMAVGNLMGNEDTVEDLSCGTMLSHALETGEVPRVFPMQDEIDRLVADRKQKRQNYPPHYLSDLELCLTLDRFTVIPRVHRVGQVFVVKPL